MPSVRPSFTSFFDGVHSPTADAPPPSFSSVQPSCSLHELQPLVVTDVRALPDKQQTTRFPHASLQITCQHPGAVPHSSFHTVPVPIRCCSSQRALRRSLDPVISWRRQLVGLVEAAGASRRLLEHSTAATWSAIRLSSSSLDRSNRYSPTSLRHWLLATSAFDTVHWFRRFH